jgi:UDP-xylose/UDP-N-acetylglucosamine transporter B4
MIGVIILALALVLSSAMGIAQDITYEKYGRGHWQEGMFYLHFLALPMFVPLVSDIQEQVRVINQSPPVSLATGLEPLGFIFIPPKSRLYYIISAISIPRYWIPLILNILTSFVCVSGVHRLTAKVSSLTVTLVLAVRKAVSLVISVILINGGKGDEWLWIGGLFVLAGTVLYAWDGQKSKGQSKVKKVD